MRAYVDYYVHLYLSVAGALECMHESVRRLLCTFIFVSGWCIGMYG
jgi:hypothetical protein